MLKSALFSGNQLLQDIADNVGGVRISQSENATDPAVLRVQRALLIRDPGCLPVRGADGVFGIESATAIHRFKLEELGIPEAQVIDDVGPSTIQRLDEIALAAEIASITLFSQYGDPLADVEITIDDDGVLSKGVTGALGTATVALTAAATLTLDPATLAAALGDLLDRPVLSADPSDPGGAAVITPQTSVTVNISPGNLLNVVVVARIDVNVELRTNLVGAVRVVGAGVKVFQEGERIRVALQVNDGSTASAFLDPPPPVSATVAPPDVTGWQPPNGYIVQPGDTADSLSQRFLGAPGLFAQLSNHDPIAGEVLILPDSAVPGWVGIGLEPLPPDPAPKIWFTVTPNSVISALHANDGQVDTLQQLLDAIASPPPADPDPSIISLANADVVTAFLTLPSELSAAEPATAEASTEGGGFDEIVG